MYQRRLIIEKSLVARSCKKIKHKTDKSHFNYQARTGGPRTRRGFKSSWRDLSQLKFRTSLEVNSLILATDEHGPPGCRHEQ